VRRAALAAAVLLVALSGAVPAVAAAGPPAAPVAADPGSGSGSGSGSSSDSDSEAAQPGAGTARILELYPNPVADGDRGEYLRLWLPGPGNWSLTDGHATARIPAWAAGRVVVSTAPEAAREHVDAPVVRLAGRLRLANGGDRVRLLRDGRPVDAVAYDRASEAEIWRRTSRTGAEGTADGVSGASGASGPGATSGADGTDGEWRPYGHEPRTPVRTGPAAVEPFLLPDAPAAPVDPLRDARERLLVAAYTFESERLADLLVRAADRGVRARLLVEGGPVGGMSRESAARLDRVADAGVDVRVMTGPRARFRFHHAKYAVADDRAVVLTENWKPSGTGGRGSRGWGVTVRSAATADELAAVFAADARQTGTEDWATFRAGRAFTEGGTADGRYPTRYPPGAAADAGVTVLTAPGNAADRVAGRIAAADRRVYAVVPRAAPDGRFVRALVRAARNGATVRLLLSGAWYDREANRDLAGSLNDRADRAGFDLEAAVAEPRGRYGTVHAKGAVVDDAAVVGSMNWNAHSAERNREVVVVVDHPAAADYFARAFAADWRGGTARLPAGMVAALAAALLAAAAVARRWLSVAAAGGR